MNRYHFNIGNSTTGALGLCGEVCAESPEAAVKMLHDHLPDEHRVCDAPNGYINVYINADAVTIHDIDMINDDDIDQKPKAPRLFVIIEGGVIEDVVSDQPAVFAGTKVVIVEYEDEYTDEAESEIIQPDGSVKKATVGEWPVGMATIRIGSMRSDEDGECGHCDTCGAPCDRDGCTADRGHQTCRRDRV